MDSDDSDLELDGEIKRGTPTYRQFRDVMRDNASLFAIIDKKDAEIENLKVDIERLRRTDVCRVMLRNVVTAEGANENIMGFVAVAPLSQLEVFVSYFLATVMKTDENAMNSIGRDLDHFLYWFRVGKHLTRLIQICPFMHGTKHMHGTNGRRLPPYTGRGCLLIHMIRGAGRKPGASLLTVYIQ
jgi:hypothetical protein